MYKVNVSDIEQDGIVNFKFNGDINELENCHIEAELEFKSMGDFIEASGHIYGNLNLECDRCLKKYIHKLDFEINEMFAKKALLEDYGAELELTDGQFITDLNGAEDIDVYDLLYQSVILALPNKKVCGINCNEGFFVSEQKLETHDTRMDIFKNIKIERK